ncbi:MAG: N-acetylmuramoyl-L-alanine amidase family protein [Actinomycetota bacterium]
MPTRRQLGLLAALLVALLVVGGVAVSARQDDRDERASPTSTTAPTAPTTEAAPTTTVAPTTTTVPPVVWPEVARDGSARAVVTPTGVVLAVSSVLEDGRFVAVSPCGREVAVAGQPLTGATVVLDPGHGGDEPGAVGPGGLREKDVNLAIAQEAERRLEAEGADVVLTRTGDYRITLAARGAIAQALQPVAFVSIHHNAEPDEMRSTPGSETYYQIASPESKRLAGLLYEELLAALSAYDITWAADLDAGAKYRPNSTGGDYYGILKRTAGIPGVLSEAAFISNPEEEALLADPGFQRVEAEAITRAVVRFATTDDPGSGFVEPYPRTQPAGPGGGSSGCEDPPLQ